ncbi:flagellar basal body-associated FliL family protein [Candidatus Puniceispirillum sp.]|nr:flagellar basal body-associated FliL family protein [Candidatus Puniceispirillum sp.]
MAADETQKTNPDKLPKLILPISIGTCVVGVLGLFFIGYKTLTSTEPVQDDIQTIMEKAKSKADNDKTLDAEKTEEQQLKPSKSQFDFSKHTYYTFPLPFITNLASGKGMLTLEIAIATYGDAMDSEEIIEMLNTSNPKLRSVINFKLSEQKLTDVNTVKKRQKLSKELLEQVKLVVRSLDGDPLAITDLHLIKFVLSGTN